MSAPPKKPSLKVLLSLYLKEKSPAWINGGELEQFAITQFYKASNGSRRCRELADEGTFERRMNGKSVEYRYRGIETQITQTRIGTVDSARILPNASIFKCSHPRCLKDAVTYLEDKPVCQGHSVRDYQLSVFCG